MQPGNRYLRPDTGEIVEVLPALGGGWLVGTRKPNGSIKRLKSKGLPVCKDVKHCQEQLDLYVEFDKNGQWPVAPDQAAEANAAEDLKAARAARERWKAGDTVRIKNGREYDGYWGRIYCLPPAKHPNWLYNVTLLDASQEHDCVDCRYDEMELVEEKEMAKTVVAERQVERTFAYESNAIVVSGEVKALEKHAKAVCETIERVRRTTAESVIKLGEHLYEAHEILCNYGDGTWGKWCTLRCGISRMQAQRVIDAYNQFGDCNTMLQTAEPTALYLLSAPSCPEEATDEAIKAAEGGERITTKRAREIIKSHQVQDDDDEPVPTRRAQVTPVVEEEAEEPPCRLIPSDEFNIAEFLLAARKWVEPWRDRCPEEELGELAQVLREIAEQIERNK